MTNFEKIFSMSLEEFAESRLHTDSNCFYIAGDFGNVYLGEDNAHEIALQKEIEWLQSECE